MYCLSVTNTRDGWMTPPRVTCSGLPVLNASVSTEWIVRAHASSQNLRIDDHEQKGKRFHNKHNGKNQQAQPSFDALSLGPVKFTLD
jgi:hypothetical protein